MDNPLKSILNEFVNLIIDIECDKYITQEIKELAKQTKYRTSQFIDIIKTFGFHLDWVIPVPDGTSSVQMGVSKPPSANYDEYDKMKKLKDEIINNLKQIALLTPSDKIIIGIDELDRCRPDYAIKTLEIIKHFFNIDKLVFVLAVDKEQLKNTVRVMYGLNANTDCYLKKFVDVEYLLPKPNNENFIKYLVETKYFTINNMFKKFNQNNLIFWKNHRNVWICNSVQDENYIINIISEIVQYYSMELRDIEKLVLKLSIIINQISAGSVLCLPFLADLVVLNTHYPYIYNFIKEKTPADNYNSYDKLQSLRRETFSFIKIMNSDRPVEDNIYECRKDLKKYFDFIDFAENFNL